VRVGAKAAEPLFFVSFGGAEDDRGSRQAGGRGRGIEREVRMNLECEPRQESDHSARYRQPTAMMSSATAGCRESSALDTRRHKNCSQRRVAKEQVIHVVVRSSRSADHICKKKTKNVEDRTGLWNVYLEERAAREAAGDGQAKAFKRQRIERAQ
jgi:hypothetical protein